MGKPAPEPDSVLNGLPDSASEKSSEDSGQDLKGSSPPSTPERSRTGDLAAVLPTPEKAAALLAAKADADHEAYAEGTGVIAAPKAPLTPAASAAARPARSPMSPAPAAVLPKVASESSSTASTLERKAPATPATPQPEAPALAQPVPAFVAPPQPDVPAEAQAVAAFIWVNGFPSWPACMPSAPCIKLACSERDSGIGKCKGLAQQSLCCLAYPQGVCTVQDIFLAIALFIVRCRKAYSWVKAAILTTLAALIGRLFNTPRAGAEAPCAGAPAVQSRNIPSGLLVQSVRSRHHMTCTLPSGSPCAQRF